MGKTKLSPGKHLMDSLTRQQLERLLDAVFSTGQIEKCLDRFKKNDADLAGTVKKIIEMRGGGSKKKSTGRIASEQKKIEDWKALWSRWDSLVFEVGDEKGKYAVQDTDWEAPYFDGYTLAGDLDQIAQDMLGFIDVIYGLVNEPELFAGAMEEIDSAISTYPEWMHIEEGCVLGKNATHCVLKWLWIALQGNKQSGAVFVRKVFDIDEAYNMVVLDGNECAGFFADLPEDTRREIYQIFLSGDYDDKINCSYSKWHTINHHYENQFNSKSYLETCRKHLAENWHYGKPLIEDAIARHDYQNAELHLVNAFSSCLRESANKKWFPETDLLLDRQSYHLSQCEEEIVGLLESWAAVSQKLGNAKRSAAAKLQSVICRLPEDWDSVVRSYRKLQSDEVKVSIDSLFAQWQTMMAKRSFGHRIGESVASDTWVHWLITSALNISEGKKCFMEQLEAWLERLMNETKMFRKQWLLLARLTKDLPSSAKLQKQYPAFYSNVLPCDKQKTKLATSRRKGLKKMGEDDRLPAVIEIWKKHLCRIVPDPADLHSSCYTECAQWMKALYELNRGEYGKLLAQWQKKHKLRRNLWRDMNALGLPI